MDCEINFLYTRLLLDYNFTRKKVFTAIPTYVILEWLLNEHANFQLPHINVKNVRASKTVDMSKVPFILTDLYIRNSSLDM